MSSLVCLCLPCLSVSVHVDLCPIITIIIMLCPAKRCRRPRFCTDLSLWRSRSILSMTFLHLILSINTSLLLQPFIFQIVMAVSYASLPITWSKNNCYLFLIVVFNFPLSLICSWQSLLVVQGFSISLTSLKDHLHAFSHFWV